MTDHFPQEDPMTKHDRHDELVALLSKISEESVTTSNVLADVLDLLRQRLPEPAEITEDQPVGFKAGDRVSFLWKDDERFTCTLVQEGRLLLSDRKDRDGYQPAVVTAGGWTFAGITDLRHEPAPADDLPGEPVEPGDLRAGDVVAFTYDGERIEGPLVRRFGLLSVEMTDHSPIDVRSILGRWAGGISDVRLIERAPQEGEDPDEALAMDLYHASLGLPPASEIGPSAYGDSSVRERFLEMARDTRKMEVIGKAIEQAEAERDALRERHGALREDVERFSAGDPLITPLDILVRDDERAAKVPAP